MTAVRIPQLVVLGLLWAWPMAAQTPQSDPAAAAPEEQAAPAAAPAVDQPAVQPAMALDGPIAMVFHVVKADKGTEFEQLFARLRAGLAASANEVRRQQGAGWRLLKQNAPTAEGHLIYVSVIDPVVPSQEYDLARLLAESYPDEGTALYQSLLGSHVQPSVQASSLTPVAAPEGQP
jgi:hypothetical protein